MHNLVILSSAISPPPLLKKLAILRDFRKNSVNPVTWSEGGRGLKISTLVPLFAVGNSENTLTNVVFFVQSFSLKPHHISDSATCGPPFQAVFSKLNVTNVHQCSEQSHFDLTLQSKESLA